MPRVQCACKIYGKDYDDIYVDSKDLLHNSPSSFTTTTAMGVTLGTWALTILDTRRSTELKLAVFANLSSRGWPNLVTPSSVSIVNSRVIVSILRGGLTPPARSS